MGVYVYMARKSQPVNVKFQGEKRTIHRFAYVSRLSDYDRGGSRINRLVGRIDSAWGDNERPEYAIIADSIKEVSFAWIYKPACRITWFDCDELGEQVGCVYRDFKGKFATMTVDEFDEIFNKVTGLTRKTMWDKRTWAVDRNTIEGHIVAQYAERVGGIKIVPIPEEVVI